MVQIRGSRVGHSINQKKTMKTRVKAFRDGLEVALIISPSNGGWLLRSPERVDPVRLSVNHLRTLVSATAILSAVEADLLREAGIIVPAYLDTEPRDRSDHGDLRYAEVFSRE